MRSSVRYVVVVCIGSGRVVVWRCGVVVVGVAVCGTGVAGS